MSDEPNKDIVEAVFILERLVQHAGPLPGEDPGLSYDDDTNTNNTYQGSLRFAPLDADALMRRIHADAAGVNSVQLMLTHRDQLERGDISPELASYGPTRNDVQEANYR